MNPNEMSLYVTKQAARMIIYTADQLVVNYTEQGILSNRDAEHLFEVSMGDTRRLNQLTHIPLSAGTSSSR